MARNKRRGITNQQAKYLGILCRELGLKYPGRGMTLEEASITIETLERRRSDRNEALRRKYSGD